MSLFIKGDEQPRKRKRNVKEGMPGAAVASGPDAAALSSGPHVGSMVVEEVPSQAVAPASDPIAMHHQAAAAAAAAAHSAPPPLDMFDPADLFGFHPGSAVGDPMFYKPEDMYHHAMAMGNAPQVVHHFSSLTLATSPRDSAMGQKSCSVCGRVESKTCKIGHRLQSCKERVHIDCKLVCNSCEDFFRRHSGGVNLKERCESMTRDPQSCQGGKSSRNCQFHRYERCLEVGMQPVAAKVEAVVKDPKSSLPSPRPAGSEASPAASSAGGAAAASATLEMPVCVKQTLPDWELARNIFNDPVLRWRAFCASLNISSSAEMPATSIEEFLAQKIEYSDLLLKYSGEEASAIWHERGSLRLCVETFFTVSPDGFSVGDLASMEGAVAFGVPVCVHVDYVAQKPMTLGRDLVPVQVPSALPLHAKAYQAYRACIPNVVAVLERKEKTTTPPFAANGSYMASRPLSVSFSLTSKIPGKTWLYIRRMKETVIAAVAPEDPIEIRDGDTLSIWNEHTEMAEHIAWRVSIPHA